MTTLKRLDRGCAATSMGPLQSFWTAWAIRYETAGNYGMAHECAIHARHYRNEGK